MEIGISLMDWGTYKYILVSYIQQLSKVIYMKGLKYVNK